MREVTFEESLTKAEAACAAHLAAFLGTKVYIDSNPDVPDCAVFNIGYLYSGEHNAFRAQAYHFRGSLDLFCRSRPELQKMAMRILANFPVNADIDPESPLRTESNVLVLRVPVETNALSSVQRTDVQSRRDARAVPTYTCSVAFDVVFRARFD